MFIPNADKEQFLEYICIAQKHYNALSRFAYRLKFKKAPLKITTDLYMNDIDQNKFNVFTLLQNGFRYQFVISDLVNIINNNLAYSHAIDFFIEPRIPKNPYNNIEFSITDMYNIYFFIN
jgi:sRNA-binding regulator protein Hfq